MIRKVALTMAGCVALLTGGSTTACTENGNGTNNRVSSMKDAVNGFDVAITTVGQRTYIFQIEKWCDYTDGEQLQIWLPDGNILLVSSYNTILVQSYEASDFVRKLAKQPDTIVYKDLRLDQEG